MEFWGVEVKPGESLKVKPEVSMVIHISQAAMGGVKNGKGPQNVHLRLKIDDKMYVIGTLSAKDRPQILFDLVLQKEFELSHDWKYGSIYLAGCVAVDDSYREDFSKSVEDDVLVDNPQNVDLDDIFGSRLEAEKKKTASTSTEQGKPRAVIGRRKVGARKHVASTVTVVDDESPGLVLASEDGQNGVKAPIEKKRKKMKIEPGESSPPFSKTSSDIPILLSRDEVKEGLELQCKSALYHITTLEQEVDILHRRSSEEEAWKKKCGLLEAEVNILSIEKNNLQIKNSDLSKQLGLEVKKVEDIAREIDKAVEAAISTAVSDFKKSYEMGKYFITAMTAARYMDQNDESKRRLGELAKEWGIDLVAVRARMDQEEAENSPEPATNLGEEEEESGGGNAKGEEIDPR